MGFPAPSILRPRQLISGSKGRNLLLPLLCPWSCHLLPIVTPTQEGEKSGGVYWVLHGHGPFLANPLRQARPLAGDHFHARTGGRVMSLMTGDEYPSFAAAIQDVYGEIIQPPRRGRGAGTPSPGWCRSGGVGQRQGAQDGEEQSGGDLRPGCHVGASVLSTNGTS
jgi:hypothetical protein